MKDKMVWGVYIVSRLIYYVKGVRYNTLLINDDRLLPRDLLEDNLLESLWYMHTQPPLTNFVLGSTYKLFGDGFAFPLYLLNVLCGIAIVWQCLFFFEKYEVPSVWKRTILLFYIISPASILFENFFIYTYPLMGMLSLASLLLWKYGTTGDFRFGISFFSILGLMALARSLFHLVWILFAVGIIWVGMPSKRRTTLKAAALPVVLVLVFYIKNLVLFGMFTLSTWFPQQLAKITLTNIPKETLQKWNEDGSVSDVALVKPLDTIVNYSHLFVETEEFKGVEVLHDSRTVNNIRFIPIYKAYGADAKWALQNNPKNYLLNIIHGTLHYFYPGSEYIAPRNNIDYYTYYFEKICLFTWFKPYSIFLIFLNILSVFILLRLLLLTKCNPYPDVARSLVFFFMLISSIYVFGVVNLLEIWENMRARVLMLPYTMVLLGIVLKEWKGVSIDYKSGFKHLIKK